MAAPPHTLEAFSIMYKWCEHVTSSSPLWFAIAHYHWSAFCQQWIAVSYCHLHGKE